MAKYLIRTEAQNDLKKIGRYTAKQWSTKQRNSYLKQFAERFIWLAANPKLGKKREDIKPGYYSYSEGRHIIFYVVRESIIEIIRILHKQMDVEQVLSHTGREEM